MPNPAAVNETLNVNGQALTVIGVAPAGFTGTTLGNRPQVFVPITMRELLQPGQSGAPSVFENRRRYWVYAFARLETDVTLEQARTAINVPYRAILNDVEAPLQEGMSDQTMERFRAREVLVAEGARGQSSVHEEATAPIILLLGVTALVLLIACSNIANLLLARAASREGEMAVRLSLGAGRGQLMRQLLTEVLPAGRPRRPGGDRRGTLDARGDSSRCFRPRRPGRSRSGSTAPHCCSPGSSPSSPGCSSACSLRCTAPGPIS